MDIKKLTDGIMDQVVIWRRELHKIPEVGKDLPKTSQYIKEKLREFGIKYREGVGLDSAILAYIDGGRGKGKTIALRADMDALPIKEDTGLEFTAESNNMHACGHDGHMAMLLGAAKLLNDIREDFPGRVVFLFQPAEEISAGAEPMIEAGALDGVDGIIGIHIGNITDEGLPGDLLFRPGPIMACLDRWSMKIKGLGSHGAYPHNGIDPIVISSNIVSSLQSIISRELAPTEPGVITVGKINGGSAYNIIPEYVELEGTARAVDSVTREVIAKRIGEIGQSIAQGYGASIEYDYYFGAPPLINHEGFTRRVMDSAKKVVNEENVKELRNPVMGGEDFAYYLEKVAGTFLFLLNPLEIDGGVYPHHNPKFAIDEKFLDRGIGLFVQASLDFLNEGLEL